MFAPAPPRLPPPCTGSGKSCHHCKSRKEDYVGHFYAFILYFLIVYINSFSLPDPNTEMLQEIVYCAFTHEKKNAKSATEKRPCHKKFCMGCIRKYYPADEPHVDPGERGVHNWTCPCCRACCCCAGCKKDKSVKVALAPALGAKPSKGLGGGTAGAGGKARPKPQRAWRPRAPLPATARPSVPDSPISAATVTALVTSAWSALRVSRVAFAFITNMSCLQIVCYSVGTH
jgi:hypothetical protein